MNLEVARSLAEGHGYRRLYAGHSGFAHEIQTRAPYILPAAAVFRIFGVGIWQAQIVNLAYLSALAVIAFLLLRRWASWRWGLLAAAVLLCTPGVRDIGMNGYGEVPALAWWLAALLVLYPERTDRPVTTARHVIGGVLIGIGIVTKTVLLIGLAAVLPVVIGVACSERRGWRAVLPAIAVVAGVSLPVVAHELARMAALGGFSVWHGWINDEVLKIRMQAGTHRGFSDTPNLLAKVVMHFHMLARHIGIPPWLLAPWLFAPLLLGFIAARRLARSMLGAVMLTLALFALIYFVWWLGMTPTVKAWYRRIFDGVVAVELLLVLVASVLWSQRRARAMAWGAVTAVLALQIPLTWAALSEAGSGGSVGAMELDQDLAALARLPPDAAMYGVGWHSNPVLALYSGRRFADISDVPPTRFLARPHAYLVLDGSSENADAAAFWLQRYHSEVVAHTDDIDIVRIDTAQTMDPFKAVVIDSASLFGYADFHAGDYPYLFGFHDRERDGWRWVSSDAEILLRYDGEPDFVLDMYMPSPSRYAAGDRLGITVWLGECRLGEISQTEEGRQRHELPVGACPMPEGQRVRVRLVSDNLVKSADERQIVFIAHGLGFAQPVGDGESATQASQDAPRQIADPAQSPGL